MPFRTENIPSLSCCLCSVTVCAAVCLCLPVPVHLPAQLHSGQDPGGTSPGFIRDREVRPCCAFAILSTLIHNPSKQALAPGQEGREAQPGVPAGSVTGLFLQHREPSTGQSAVCQCQRSVLGKAFPSFSGFPAHRYALEIFTNWRGLWQLGHLGMSLLMEAKRMEQGPAGHGFAHPSRCLGATSGGHALVFVVRLSPP